MFALSIFEYFKYDFVWYAMIATVFIAVCSAFVGVTLVLKRLSNIGDGLSHVAFGAMSIGIVAGFASSIGGTILSVFVTGGVSFALITVKSSTKIKGDSLIAMISVFSLAFAYFIINVFKTGGNVAGDVCTTLFGSSSILALQPVDVIVSGVLCLATIAVYVIFYNKIFVISFDESFARASGIETKIYESIIAVTIAIIVSLAIRLVGSLLVTALLVFPALSAMRVAKSYKIVTIVSVILAVVNAVTGVLISMVAGSPVGSTIVLVEAFTFIVCLVVGIILRRK
ncbi:MAG: metal ABC transporter permease [Bacilli bacterium]|nr:metal ABC transporter permease [Bacilli bacterium]